MIPRSQVVHLLIRFSLIYAVFVTLAVRYPVYETIERAAVGLVNASFVLVDGEDAERSLSLVENAGQWSYVYKLRLDSRAPRTIRRPFHAHPFTLVLFLALVLGTPSLSARRVLVSLGVGGVLVFLLGVGMLLVDVQQWDPSPDGPYPSVVSLMKGLHVTAAGGLLPLILWSFIIAGPLAAELRRASEEPAP